MRIDVRALDVPTAPRRPWPSGQTITLTHYPSWHLRGHVRIVDPASTVSADEVDVETGSNGIMQLDLRGNVHMTMTMNPTR